MVEGQHGTTIDGKFRGDRDGEQRSKSGRGSLKYNYDRGKIGDSAEMGDLIGVNENMATFVAGNTNLNYKDGMTFNG